jgi:hypothetical protein
MKQKALPGNPDEFYFGMQQHTQVQDGQHKRLKSPTERI